MTSPLEDLPHDVDGLPLGLVIGPDEHLPQEPDADELEAHQDQEHGEEQDGPVGQGRAVDDALEGEDPAQEDPRAPQAEAKETEDLDGTRPVAHEELDGEVIEEDPHRPPETVL